MGMIRFIHETIQSLKENMDAGRLNLPQQISELHQQRCWEAPSSALKEGFQQTLQETLQETLQPAIERGVERSLRPILQQILQTVGSLQQTLEGILPRKQNVPTLNGNQHPVTHVTDFGPDAGRRRKEISAAPVQSKKRPAAGSPRRIPPLSLQTQQLVPGRQRITPSAASIRTTPPNAGMSGPSMSRHPAQSFLNGTK